MSSSRRASAIAVFVVAASALVSAQQTPAQSRELALSTARRALTGGQPTAAIRAVEPILARTPGDREAVDLAIQASVALEDSPRAWAVYDAFVQAGGVNVISLLKPVVVRELRRIADAAGNDPRLRDEALERLARGGEAKAVADLRQSGGAGQERLGLLADTALARLGDEAAKARIAAAVASPDAMGKTAAVEAVRRSGLADQAPLLVPLLQHRDPYTRIAAVETMAALGYKGAIPEMRQLLGDPAIEVRSKAALALVRLGDDAGRPLVASMLRSPVADVRLKALDADPSIVGAERSATIHAILNDPDPLTRVMAAEALARDEPEAAKAALVALLGDPDPLTRREAARGLETLASADLALYRRLMQDREPWVRMYGAGGVLRAATRPQGAS